MWSGYPVADYVKEVRVIGLIVLVKIIETKNCSAAENQEYNNIEISFPHYAMLFQNESQIHISILKSGKTCSGNIFKSFLYFILINQ